MNVVVNTFDPTVDDLCRTSHNEDPHTLHVTRLALELFDTTYAQLKVDPGTRRLLEAAARLHDIGYFEAAEGHARAGAERVLRSGVAGFSLAECKVMASAILLHPRQIRDTLGSLPASEPDDRVKALQVASYLRIADGLDHGHIQDASLVRIDCRADMVEVEVVSPGYGANVPWARAKADLWNQVMPVPVTLEAADCDHHAPLFGAVVRPGDSITEAARRILYSQYRVIVDNRAAALAHEGAAPLHDIRVAIRRFRSALRMFRKALASTSARRINQDLRSLNRALGAARDADVWLAYLSHPDRGEVIPESAGWTKFMARQEAGRMNQVQNLSALLSGEDYAALLRRVRWFLRIEMCDVLRSGSAGSLKAYAARRLRRIYRGILKQTCPGEFATSEEMHDVRKRVRRGRYWAEFCAPVLKPSVRDLARRFKRLADGLGDLRDVEIALEHRLPKIEGVPPELAGILTRNREAYRRDVVSAWDRLHRKKFRKRIMNALAKG